LIARGEGSGSDQIQKAFVFKAQMEISRCPFLTEARAAVGTRLHGTLVNTLNSQRDFNPLPTDRKLGAGAWEARPFSTPV
jgi:hypothetical protein